MLTQIARKEVREILRDGRLRVLGALAVVLTLAALGFGVLQAERAEHDREHAAERSETQWEGQGEKNPHVAAHYGTHVFAPTTVATALDPGVSPFLGRAVKVEAHKRNLANHSQAQDSGGAQRMGEFSVASVLLLLVPLLLVALGYGMWSHERERGTLRQVMSTGVSRGPLLLGKSLALALVLSGLMVPAALIILSVLWSLSGGDGSTLGRLGLLALGYGVYFTIFGALTLFASAVARSSRGALVIMVGLWGLFCLVIPRVATELASRMEPLPSQGQLARDVTESLENGIDGQTSREATIEAMVEELLGASDGLDISPFLAPSIQSAAELRAEAKWEDMAFDHHMNRLDDRIAAQEATVEWAGFLSPFVAMRTLSAALCGTDYAHHRHFTDHAEVYRKALVDQLNKDFSDNAGADGWDYQAGEDLWKNAPTFTYEAPEVNFVFEQHRTSVWALSFWLVLAVFLAVWSARRVRVV